MLIPFTAYRRRYAVHVLISIAILNSLLLLGLATKTAVSPGEWAFAVAAIIAGVSFASVRDAIGVLAYAGESAKFYRDEADFELLARYAGGWRHWLSKLAYPWISALVLSILLTAAYALGNVAWGEASCPRLIFTALMLVLVFPGILSWLLHFLAPVLVGWKEVRARLTPSATKASGSLPQLLRQTAAVDVLITALITAALTLPLRHSPDFHPASGYASPEFMIAALLLTMIVLPLSLISAWRPRVYACSGELYRHTGIDLAALPLTATGTSRWKRWLRYSLTLCSLTIITCLLLDAMYTDAPILIALTLLLLPVVPIVWIERNMLLGLNYHDAAQLVREYPLRTMSAEKMLEFVQGIELDADRH